MLAIFHSAVARIRAYMRPQDLDREFDEELEAHLALAEADKIKQGMPSEQARRAARIELGGLTQLREAGHEARGLPHLDTFWLDIKLGLRMLRKSWGLTLIGGLAMTLAIIIGIAVFTFFAWATGDSLPLDDGEDVVAFKIQEAATRELRGTAMQDFERWRDTLRSVVDLGAFQAVERNFALGNDALGDTGGSLVEPVTVAEMTAAGFRLARVAPLLGRTLAEDDESIGAPPVVVIGYDVWQSRFAADPAVVGETVLLGGVAHTVVGVMPEDFAFPVNHRFWTALAFDRSAQLPAPPEGAVFGRLAPGVTLERAQTELAAVGLLPPAEIEDRDEQRRAQVLPYVAGISSDDPAQLRWIVRLGLILVSLLLVPPCANIAILVYARTMTRQEEFAARYALGANRRRIVAQLFIEMLVLAGAAAVVALLAVRLALGWIVDQLITHQAGQVPFWLDLTLPVEAAVFAAVLAVVAAVVAGLIPALKATGQAMRTGLRALGSRTGTQLGRTWTALVVLQVAMTLAALPVAIEIGWGTIRKGAIGPGFPADEYLTARIALERRTTDDEIPKDASNSYLTRFTMLQKELIQRLQSEPDIAGATIGSLPGDEPWEFIQFDPRTPTNADLISSRNLIRTGRVDESFFDVFDIPFLTGRDFAARDFQHEDTAVIVNWTFVQQHLGEVNPLGVRLRYVPSRQAETQDEPTPKPWLEIVGVVADRPAGATNGTVYRPIVGGQMVAETLSIHATSDLASLADRLRTMAAAVDPTLQVSTTLSLDAVYHEKAFGNNVGALSLGAIMLSVLLLSAAGMYALMSFTVNQRRREIGIRAALGAQPRSLLAGIFKRALQQLGAGAAAGIAIAMLVGHFLPAEQLGGWRVPGVIPAAAALMLLIGLLAVAGPARRGLRVDPIEELRQG